MNKAAVKRQSEQDDNCFQISMFERVAFDVAADFCPRSSESGVNQLRIHRFKIGTLNVLF